MSVSAYLQQIKKTSQEIVGWTKGNPLKISGITGVTAEALMAYAGEMSLNNHLLFAGGILGISAYITQALWGRGGKEEETIKEALPTKPQPSKQRIRDLFSIQKCLSCWRYPVESAAFQGFLSGLCYAASGVLPYIKDGTLGPTETSLFSLGLFCMIGGVYANCVPEQKGKMSPLAKAACWYGLCTLSLGATAISTLAPPLFIATGLFAISNYALGVSVRHDNKMRKQLGPLAPQL
jgi:hypothetical protein